MKERISRRRFIRLGAAIGVSTAGATVVAACGGGESGGSGSGWRRGLFGLVKEQLLPEHPAALPRTGSSSGAIAQVSEVPTSSAKKFTNDGQPAVLVHLQGGDFVAYSAVCTHQQCTVAYQDGQLACPCHGSVFDPSNGGEVVNGPAPEPLPEIPIQVQNGQVTKA